MNDSGPFRDVRPIYVKGYIDYGDQVRVADLGTCWRMRSFFGTKTTDPAWRCVVCKRSYDEHQIGPCGFQRAQFTVPGRCPGCGDYTREHRP